MKELPLDYLHLPECKGRDQTQTGQTSTPASADFHAKGLRIVTIYMPNKVDIKLIRVLFLINMDGSIVLVDPVFSGSAAPVSFARSLKTSTYSV